MVRLRGRLLLHIMARGRPSTEQSRGRRKGLRRGRRGDRGRVLAIREVVRVLRVAGIGMSGFHAGGPGRVRDERTMQ